MEISKILKLDKPTSLVLLKNGKEKLLLTTELQEVINKQLTIHSVVKSLPTKDEIDKKVDDYAFIVPYDGSNNFYNEQALKHFKAGVDWLKKEIEK